MGLTVSGLADRVVLSPAAVRYYERCGLLPVLATLVHEDGASGASPL
jgi:hypothetical protein